MSSFRLSKIYPLLLGSILFLHLASRSLAQQLTWDNPYLTQNIAVGGTGCDLVFTFKNNGKQTVTITEAQTSCSCSEAEIINAITKPGESGQIKVHYNRRNAVGEKHLTVLVKTDANNQPITLNAAIHNPQLIQVSPIFMQWKVGENPSSKEAELILATEAQAKPIKPLVAGDFDIRLMPTGDKTRYKLYVSPKSTAQATQGSITLQTGINDPGGSVTLNLLVKP